MNDEGRGEQQNGVVVLTIMLILTRARGGVADRCAVTFG